MREGGLDALFFSIWVPSDITRPTAVKRALDPIDSFSLYPWDRVRMQVQNRVVNECRAADIWPRLAEVCTWRSGVAAA
jgi:hypothetical protein